MLAWERRHPYNALHALRLRGPADASALGHAIQQVYRLSGIGELFLDKRMTSYSYRPSNSIPVNELPPTADINQTIRRVADESMNAPFPAGAHQPVRWYIADVPSEDAHLVVAVYHHVAADAAGVEALLASVLRDYLLPDGIGKPGELVIEPPERATDRRRPFRKYGVLRSYVRTLALSWRVFWSRRPRSEMPGDDRTGMVLRAAPDGLFARLQRRCVGQGIGVNDVFLAALACAIHAKLCPRSRRPGRTRMVLGTVLSRRPKWFAGAQDFFGVDLSDIILPVDRPEDPVGVLAERIAVQTRQWKANPLAADAISDMRLFLAKLSWPFLRNTRQSYRRFFPVCGGVSTVFVNQTRFGPLAEGIERYVRACPPGPVMPIVVAPTIYGSRLEFTLVHRLSCIDATAADALLQRIIASLEEFAGAGRSAPIYAPEISKSLERVGAPT